MKMDKKQLGYYGEDMVCGYLESHGYKIVEQNYTIRGGEIDIIAENDSYIVFVEVKTRKQGSMVSGFEAVTPSKQKLIIRTAEDYLAKHDSELQPRFDIAAVESCNGMITDIDYIENAFDASR